MKRLLLIAGMIFVGILIVFSALILLIAVEGFKVGSFDWFPKNEEDIVMGKIIWFLFACLCGCIGIILILVEIMLIKKIRSIPSDK